MKTEVLNNESATVRVNEEIIDAIEEVPERVVEIIRNNPAVLVGVAVAGVAVGAYAGYKFAKKRLTVQYEEILSEEIEAAKKFYAHLNKVDDPTPEDAVKNRISAEEVSAVEALRTYEGVEVVSKKEVEVEQNVFLKKDDFDYERALEERLENGGELPYVISHVEFMENEPEHEQEHVTYFEGDDILCDEKDESLEPRYTVGEDFASLFGYGSNDNNVVHIRNEKLEIDYEITRSRGKYTREVLGVVDDELKHSDSRHRSRRFRAGDDE